MPKYRVNFDSQSAMILERESKAEAEFDARLIVWKHAKIWAKVKSMEVVKIERNQ